MTYYLYRGTALVGKYDDEKAAKKAAKAGDVVSTDFLVFDINGNAATSPGHELHPHAHDQPKTRK